MLPHRFRVAVPRNKSQKLLGPTRLNHLLDLTEVCPEPISDVVELSGRILPTADLGRHVMECHRRLAELGGPREESFRSIADQLARELGEAGAATRRRTSTKSPRAEVRRGSERTTFAGAESRPDTSLPRGRSDSALGSTRGRHRDGLETGMGWKRGRAGNGDAASVRSEKVLGLQWGRS